ncbi:MAG: hypothetical protein ACFFA4_16290 [Promethearchaeota archaeon]
MIEKELKIKEKRFTISFFHYLPSISIPNRLMLAKKLYEEGNSNEALKFIDEFDKKKGLSLEDQLSSHLLRINLLLKLNRFEDAIKFAKQAYQKSQKTGKNLQSLDILIYLAWALQGRWKLNESYNVIKQCENLIKSLIEESPTEILVRKSILIRLEGEIYRFKGDINQCLKCEKQSLILAEKLNDKGLIVACLYNLSMIYKEISDYSSALECIDRSLEFFDDKSLDIDLKAYTLNDAVEILTSKGELERAQKYLQRLKKLNNEEDSKDVNTIYCLSKALTLKATLQIPNLRKAEEVLKQILNGEIFYFEYRLKILIHLCDLLLIELRMTNSIELLNEIQSYINQIINISKNQQSYWMLTEIYLFRAKLKLIIFKFEEAHRLLTKAYDVAEKSGQTRLAKRIMNEQFELSNNFMKWEKLKASKAKISERMDLACIDEQIEILLKKRNYLRRLMLNPNH